MKNFFTLLTSLLIVGSLQPTTADLFSFLFPSTSYDMDDIINDLGLNSSRWSDFDYVPADGITFRPNPLEGAVVMNDITLGGLFSKGVASGVLKVAGFINATGFIVPVTGRTTGQFYTPLVQAGGNVFSLRQMDGAIQVVKLVAAGGYIEDDDWTGIISVANGAVTLGGFFRRGLVAGELNILRFKISWKLNPLAVSVFLVPFIPLGQLLHLNEIFCFDASYQDTSPLVLGTSWL